MYGVDVVKEGANAVTASLAKYNVDAVRQKIFTIRRQRVILDRDLAETYEVETGALNRAVKRNMHRFPADFIFQLTKDENEALRCQSGISNVDLLRRLLDLIDPPEQSAPPKKEIGFGVKERRAKYRTGSMKQEAKWPRYETLRKQSRTDPRRTT